MSTRKFFNNLKEDARCGLRKIYAKIFGDRTTIFFSRISRKQNSDLFIWNEYDRAIENTNKEKSSYNLTSADFRKYPIHFEKK